MTHRLSSCSLCAVSVGSVVVVHGLNCPEACGIFPNQGLSPCILHLQADSFFFLIVFNINLFFSFILILYVFPIPIPPPTSLSTQFLWAFPVHQAQALVSCIQPGLVICFTLDNIRVSMLFSRNILPSHSPTESRILFCTDGFLTRTTRDVQVLLFLL